MLFVENRGDLTIGSTAVVSNALVSMDIAGITLSNKIYYNQVSNRGNINVLRINQSNEMYVAGISKRLAYNETLNEAYTMINTINRGNIIVADARGNTTVTGSAASTTYSSNMTSRNIFIAGIVNINSGEIKKRL